MRIPYIGRTVLAGGGSGRGNHAAKRDPIGRTCLPKAQAPEEHGGRSACFVSP